MRALTRRLLAGTAVAVLATAGTAGTALAGDGHHYRHGRGHHTILKAELTGSLTTDPTLFGVAPGGADWTPGRSTVRLKDDGRVDVRVRDLLVTATGVNPVPTISASLACNGAVVDTVGPVAFDTRGNARIKDRFMVPERCLAPVVMLNPADRTAVYIAVSALG